MIGIYYNKNTLNDCLVININNTKIIDEKINNDFAIGYDENNAVAYINIFNFSNYAKLNSGFIKLTNNLCSIIKEITNVDLFSYLEANNFVVGEITKCKDIEGTHLHLCSVSVGKEELQIVCGAKNAREGIRVVVATIGAILPNGLVIKPGELLGHKSFGMLCSAKELNIKNKFNNEGIIELENKYRVGSKFDEVFIEPIQA